MKSIEKLQTDASVENSVEKEKRIEVIQGIRDRYGILFISTQKEEVFNELGIKNDAQWFRDALGVPESDKRFKTIHAPSENLPETIEESGIIIGGSAHSTYEKNQPWIQHLEEFIRNMAQRKIPILGVCFGHQLVVQSFGGKVEKNPEGMEFGTYSVDLTKEGALDPLFQDMSNKFKAQEAHSDIVTKLPDIEKVAILACNDMSVYQGLGIDERIRTVQFHPEVKDDVLKKVAELRKERFKNIGFIKDEEEFAKLITSIEDTEEAKKVLRNFDKNFIVKYLLKPDK